MPSQPTSNGSASSAVSPGWRFLVDENLPAMLADMLGAAGYFAEYAQDVGLQSLDDDLVFAYAQTHNQTIVTLDGDFGDIRHYVPPHAGIVVVDLPDSVPILTRLQIILDGLASLAGQSLANALILIDMRRVRVRRP